MSSRVIPDEMAQLTRAVGEVNTTLRVLGAEVVTDEETGQPHLRLKDGTMSVPLGRSAEGT